MRFKQTASLVLRSSRRPVFRTKPFHLILQICYYFIFTCICARLAGLSCELGLTTSDSGDALVSNTRAASVCFNKLLMNARASPPYQEMIDFPNGQKEVDC